MADFYLVPRRTIYVIIIFLEGAGLHGVVVIHKTHVYQHQF